LDASPFLAAPLLLEPHGQRVVTVVEGSPMRGVLWSLAFGGDADTRDGVLVEAFQELLLRVRADDPARIFLYVRQALRRGAFRAMKEVFAWQQVGFGTEADLEPDPRTESEPRLIGVWLKGYAAVDVSRALDRWPKVVQIVVS
jgi:hypothetical protein